MEKRKRKERKTWAVRSKPIKWRSLQLTTLRSYTFCKSIDVADACGPQLCVSTCIILQCNIAELYATRRKLCLHGVHKALRVPVYKQNHISPLLLCSNTTLSRILKKERSLRALENKYWEKYLDPKRTQQQEGREKCVMRRFIIIIIHHDLGLNRPVSAYEEIHKA